MCIYIIQCRCIWHVVCQMMSTLQKSAPSLWDNFYNLHAVWSKKHVGHVGPMRTHQHLRSAEKFAMQSRCALTSGKQT